MVESWLDTLGVTLVAVGAALLATWLGKRGRTVILIGWGAALVLVLLIGFSRRVEALNFHWPFDWLTAGRREFLVFGFAGPVLLLTPVSLMHRPTERRLIKLLALLVVFYFAILPFVQAVVARPRLTVLESHFDDHGVCRQSYDYTCGPAAAVTALRRLRIDAREGDLAVLAHTSPIAGTAPDTLADAINTRFGEQGVVAEYRWFHGIDELDNDGVTLAVVRGGLWYDHFVAVLDISDDEILIADPIDGLHKLSRDTFRRMWRGSGVTIRRQWR